MGYTSQTQIRHKEISFGCLFITRNSRDSKFVGHHSTRALISLRTPSKVSEVHKCVKGGFGFGIKRQFDFCALQ
jgi:hypothetical protein